MKTYAKLKACAVKIVQRARKSSNFRQANVHASPVTLSPETNPMTLTAVIDFETTGLSPAQGDRATEIAIVLLEGGREVDRFASLMNAGVRISSFIEAYTGISNAMVAAAPPAAVVMADAARFVGAAPMVAHNASFDRRFWEAEMALACLGDDAYADGADDRGSGCGSANRSSSGGDASSVQPPSHVPRCQPAFACTLLLSRRLYPEAASFKLGSLAAFHSLPASGRAHRAMADAEVAAHLFSRICRDVKRRYDVLHITHALLVKLQAAQKHALRAVVERHGKAADCAGIAVARNAAGAGGSARVEQPA